MRARTPLGKLACTLALMAMMLLLSHCMETPTQGETPLPSPTSAEVLVRIPGITEPADGFPCGRGSWDALLFGVTSEEQLTQWLAVSEYVHRPSLGDGWTEPAGTDPFYKAHTFSWLVVGDEGVFRNTLALDVVSGTLESLQTSFYYSLTLEQTVAQLGHPDLVGVYLDLRYEELAYSYDLYYLEQGIRVGGSIYDNALCQQMVDSQQALLEASWLVTELGCSQGGTAAEVVSAMYGITPETARPMIRLLQAWAGFGPQYSILK